MEGKKIKLKISLIILAVIIFLITGLFVYFTIDESPYNDNHLLIKREVVSEEENGFNEIKASLKWYVKAENINKSQSVYISKLELDKRKELLNKIAFVEDGHKEIDETFLLEYLKINQKSLNALLSLLNYNKFYFGAQPKLFDEDKISQLIEIHNITMPLMAKSRYYFDRDEKLKQLALFKKCFLISNIIDENCISVFGNIASYKFTGEIVNKIIENLKINKFKAEGVYNVLGDLEKFKSKPESYVSLLKSNYLMMKTTTLTQQNIDKHDISFMKIYSKFLVKINMTNRKIGEAFTSSIANSEGGYEKSALKSNNSDEFLMRFNSNSLGNILVVVLLPAVDVWRRYYYINNSRLVLLNTLIALIRFDKKYSKLPDRLEQLIPEFLVKLPIDPFNNDPINYSKIERKVWSKGFEILNKSGLPLVEEKELFLIIPF
ncbi:MAG: hypothetical protein COA79_18930 [Planctomycetota bacterium]|nr:MAG: hypothetical protein COA79_18930 [Planctomycetota bacterium]